MSISFSPTRRALLATGLASAVLALSACTGSASEPLAFEGNDITGTHLGRDLEMPDTRGQLRTLADFNGKVSLIFFGYTQCPDVCPTALAQAALALETLGDDAKDVQVIMISVDPDRDTPEILEAYLQAFNPDFIGLTGSADQLDETARSFKVFYSKEAGPTPEQYAMNHSAAFYLMDRKGEARALLNSTSATPEEIAHDIRLLL